METGGRMKAIIEGVNPEAGVVKSADRVLDLFELLAGWGLEMSHAEIAQALDIPKGSLSKLMKNLITRNYVEYRPQSKGYCLGSALGRLASRSIQARDLVLQAEPILQWLTAQTAESSALNQLRVDQLEVVAAVSSEQRLMYHLRLGDVAPLYAVSGGKAILAHLPSTALEQYLSTAQFVAHTPNTIKSIEDLTVQLDEVRKTGIAFSYEEFTPGIIGVAVPLLSQSGYPIGALNVAMPAIRFTTATKQRVIEMLRMAAQRLGGNYPVD